MLGIFAAVAITLAVIGIYGVPGMLFGVTPLDVTTFAAVSPMFAVVATLASYVPARRATRIDPLVALRND